MLRQLALAVAVAFAALPAAADDDIEDRVANGTVAQAMDRLEKAVTDAGATVFARIDHAGNASKAGLEMPASELLIFGNPKLGTPLMLTDPRAGLFLPQKILIYSDENGETRVIYREVDEIFDDLDIDDDHEAIRKMKDAMAQFAAAAAG
nr:DUF302 domain-containing protein [Oceaniovalibus guishaninsula]